MSKTLYDKIPTAKVSTYKKASKNYRKLYQLAKPTMKRGDGAKLKKAFHFALAAEQKKQYWAENSNILRALDIARIIAEDMGLGVVPIICALLYDLVLVDEITPAEIKKIFGSKVAQIIYKLIALESISQLRTIRSTQSSESLIAALTQDPRVVLLKMAENLHKMRILANLLQKQQAAIASQAKYVYVPIAHRLGLNAIKAELEDLYFKSTNAKVYRAITDQIKSSRDTRERFIRRFKRSIQELLRRKNLPFTIKARIKSVTSIWNKMNALGLSFEQVHDIFAIRIILDVPKSREKLGCWQAYEVVTSCYKVHPNKFRNWLGYPRNNGYQSLHATVLSHEGVWVEVQIRTKRMDEIAEKGCAAHWQYKKDGNIEYIPSLDTWLRQIRTALEQKPQDAEEIIETIDTSLQIDKIEVSTHKNESRLLPVGATVLDFAFELGTSFGLRCTGGQVNNKLVHYHYTLDHGDQVKVITASMPQVLEDWLDFVTTCKAYNAIKKFLQHKKDTIIASGKKLVRGLLKQFHLEWNSESIELLLVFLDEEKTEDLYYKLGEGSIALRQLKNLSSTLLKTQKHQLPHQKLRPRMQRFNRQKQQPLIINGRKVVNYKRAPCCRPRSGDKVFGYFNSQRMMEIHKETCMQAHESTWYHSKSIRDVKWRTLNHLSLELHIESLDCPHIIDAIRQVIFKEYPIDTQSIFVTSKQGIASGSVKLNQSKNYNKGISKIVQLKGVINISRTDA